MIGMCPHCYGRGWWPTEDGECYCRCFHGVRARANDEAVDVGEIDEAEVIYLLRALEARDRRLDGAITSIDLSFTAPPARSCAALLTRLAVRP